MRSIGSCLLVLCLFHCGGGAPAEVVGSPLTAEDIQYFEDGIDLVADPESLEGEWRRQWSTELDQRVQRADVVAYVRVRTVRTDTDLDRRTTYRIQVESERDLVGTLPADGVELRSREGEVGFGTIDGNEQRILDRPFVLFLKWDRPTGAATATPRFHLSPFVEQVTTRTEYLLERRRDVHTRPQGTVIVHTQTD
jgi:hypothetical protein